MKVLITGGVSFTPLRQIAREYLDWVQDQPQALDNSIQAAKVIRQMGVIRRAK